MVILLAAHFLAAALSPALARWLDRRAFLVLAIVPAVSFAWLLPRVIDATEGRSSVESYAWASSIGLDVDLVLGPISGPVSLLVTGIGALVLFYCGWYFKPDDTELWRFTSVFTAFAGAMLGLVLSDNVYLLYVFWELTTVLSFLLVGHNPERRANRRAAMNALLVTTFGGLAMFVGLVILHLASGTTSLTAIIADPPAATTTVQIGVALVLLGAVSKSALVPFHFWLPGAMAAPTPVSAYLHAAAMVKAGVFLVAVMSPAFADLPWWRPTLIVLGLATMIIGGLRALRQYDIKLLLAYGTVSQLGFLTLVAGLGTRAAAVAGLALLVSHALFKATLFLVVGIVDRSAGTRDLRELSGLAKLLPLPLVAAVVAGASMAGVPPTLGFVAKEAVLASLEALDADTGTAVWGTVALVGVVLGSILTVAYTARFIWGAFANKPGVEPSGIVRRSRWFGLAPAVLAALSLLAGFAGPQLTDAFSGAGEAYPAGAHELELTLWHGINLAVVLSAVSIVFGLALFFGRRAVAAGQHLVTDHVRLPDAELAYHAVIRGVDRLSVEVTGRTQRGSLPFYVGTILVVVALVPGSMLVRAGLEGGALDVQLADRPLQLVVVALVIGAAIAGTRSRRRLRAVLLVGLTGYGTALLFVAHGAPDLGLTQVLVETFLLVTFILVLRRLPPFFSSRPFTADRWVRIAAGVLTGVVVAGLALVTAGSRTADPVGQDFAGPAVEYGGGYNIVNVTLVDIRAWDTLGELSVLVVAATGIASLIHLITDRSGRISRSPAGQGGQRWLGRVSNVRPERRSVVFEVVTRLIFHALIIYSIYIMLVGHNEPGGGFAGGLVAGLALMVRYLVGGRQELDAAAPVDAGLVLGSGLAIAATAGLLPTLLGGGVLQSAIIDIPLGPLGELHLVTSVLFDVGVYLVVIGLALDVLRSLGGGIDRHISEEQGSEGRVVA